MGLLMSHPQCNKPTLEVPTIAREANAMRIDAHHHFWRYTREEYGWMGDEMAAIRRDFLPEDLMRQMGAAGIEQVISVQARQTIEETRWLLGLADANDFIRGVVGWVPLASPNVKAELERFAVNPKLRAVRHVLQDEPDDGYVLRADFNRGIDLLGGFGLRYDILVFERQLPQTIRFVDRHPGQVFILDHVAKPQIKAGRIEPWASNLRELARRPHVYCKLSGMVTEADWRTWTADQLRPYVDVALEAFGPRRLMLGSDWPVCLVACDYARWVATVQDYVAALAPAEQDWIMGRAAAEAYALR